MNIKPTLINIEDTHLNKQKPPTFALFEFAFRPFFLLASVFSVIHLMLWVFVYVGRYLPEMSNVVLSPFLWHGHEMVFGYAYAIIAGFLLTAVTNWTGQKTLIRKPLMLLMALWLAARMGFIVGGVGFVIAAVADIIVVTWVLRPVIKTNNRRQYGFVSKLVLLLLAQILFYLGLFNVVDQGTTYGVYLGFYLCIAIVLTMGRRVIPFFIQRALGLSEDLKNPKWLDISSLVLFTIFSIWDTFFADHVGLAVLSLVLFVLYAIRLFNWYGKGLFKHPLIWILWLSNGVLICGFILKATAVWGLNSPFLALHAFAFGGIAMMTLGMMARVGLGHTGRNVFAPPKRLTPAFICLLLAAIVRVILPLLLPQHYSLLIMLAVSLWLAAITIFLSYYAKVFIRPRADGKLG